MYPWIKHSFTGIHYYKSRSYAKNENPIHKGTFTYEYLDDNPRMNFRKGDIVKFSDGFYHTPFSDWKEWFLERRDKKKFYKRDPKVPVYARNQLAIVIGRYRKVKFKYSRFADYGVIIMMLSGPKIGHIRHYWGTGMNRPFKIVGRFPKLPSAKYLLNKILQQIKEIYSEPYEDSNESRNNLVSRVYQVFQEGT